MSLEVERICNIVAENYINCPKGELRRLFHGRGGKYENCKFINIDSFPPALLVTLYEEKTTEWKESLSSSLYELDGIEAVVIQSRKNVPWSSELLKGVLPENHTAKENGFLYSVSLERGENPGIFLDMREGRNYLRAISKGKRIINLFSYTCAFSVAAAGGGAHAILNMDLNSNSLNRGRINHRLNGDACSNVTYLSHNILKSFGKIQKKGPFDLIIIDPPPSQGNSFNMERDYAKILRRSTDFLSNTGEIMACLNSHTRDLNWFKDFLKQNLGDYKILREFGAGDDFPEKDPQFGLKIIHFKPIGNK